MATLAEKERLIDFMNMAMGGLNRSNYAKRLGVERQTVAGWFEGKSFPDGDSLLKIAESGGLSFDELQAFLKTGKMPDTSEFSRLLGRISRLQPEQVVEVQKVLTNRIEELLRSR